MLAIMISWRMVILMKELSGEGMGSNKNSPGQNHSFAECVCKGKKKDLLNTPHILIGSFPLYFFPLS